MMQKFKDFMTAITFEDRIAIVHHTDSDGICSAVLFSKAIKKIRHKAVDLCLYQKPFETKLTKKTKAILKEKNIDKLIVLDLCIDEDSNAILGLETIQQILVIDHHKIFKDLNSEQVVYIKPQLFHAKVEAQYYCTSKICYDLLNPLVSLRRSAWIAALGIFGDGATKAWYGFLKIVCEQYGYEMHQLKTIASVIHAVEVIETKNLGKCFKTLYLAQHPEEIIRSDLMKYLGLMRDEHRRIIKRHPIEIYPKKKMVFHQLESAFQMKSLLCEHLANKYPDHNIIVAQKAGDGFMNIGIRNNGTANQLICKAIKGLKNACGGGHPTAAAARICYSDFPEFKKRIMGIQIVGGGFTGEAKSSPVSLS